MVSFKKPTWLVKFVFKRNLIGQMGLHRTFNFHFLNRRVVFHFAWGQGLKFEKFKLIIKLLGEFLLRRLQFFIKRSIPLLYSNQVSMFRLLLFPLIEVKLAIFYNDFEITRNFLNSIEILRKFSFHLHFISFENCKEKHIS